MGDKVMTPEFRASFADVFVPRAPEEGKEPVYAVTMLFAKDADLSALKAAAKAAAIEKWGADQNKWPKNLKLPFRDQGEKDYDGYEAGCIFVRASSKQKPGLVDANVQPIIDPSEFYSGCYARATVNAFAWGGAAHQKGQNGVSFGLQNIQKIHDGEAFGGRSKPTDDFAPVGGGVAGGPAPAAPGTTPPAAQTAVDLFA